MRRLPARPVLAAALAQAMAERTAQIAADGDQVSAANRIYTNARQSAWFMPVIEALRTMAGLGERCMFCSGNECSQVEHFQPKAIFPLQAMVWENLLWVCGICNQFKGERFPPETEPGERIINPIAENVWDFFFIDEFGNLTARWNPHSGGLDQRALATIEILGLDRDALQQTRQARLDDLRQKVTDAVALFGNGALSHQELRERALGWIPQPFQPDVADYFLRGPGTAEQPFTNLLEITGPI